MSFRKYQVIRGSEITRLLAPAEPRKEEFRRELDKQVAEKSIRRTNLEISSEYRRPTEIPQTARTKILIEKELKIKNLENQVAELKNKISPNIMEKSLQGFSHFQALRVSAAENSEDPLNDSLPCEVKFVTISDSSKIWYPAAPRPLTQPSRKKNLRISTTPASGSASNFFPASTRSDLPIDAARVVNALKMATDMNPNMRQKYLEFFEVLKEKQKNPKKDPWASESSGSPL